MDNKKNNTTSTGDNIVVEKTKDKTIEIEKDKLSALLDTNTALLSRVERLESAANKAGLARYDSQHEGELRRVVSLIQYDGMIVKSWSDMKKNVVEQDVQTKAWREEQIIEVNFFEIEKPIELHYMEFSRGYTKVKAEIIKEQINMGKDAEKYGDRTYTVKTKEGKEYEIGKKFVN